MDMKRLSALQTAGIDTESALRRFGGNSALYEKFLMKFPQDDSFAQIGPALEQEDWAAALTAAHTLKGVSGNLGMDRLFRSCSEIVSLLREKNDAEAVKAYEKLQSAYEDVIRALK